MRRHSSHLLSGDGEEAAREEGEVVAGVEAVPQRRQRVHARRAPRRAAALVRRAAQPRVRVLVPARHRRAEVLRELRQWVMANVCKCLTSTHGRLNK